MKAVILAGGFGTRISEESVHKPKPMISLGGMPIIWHIMKLYSFHGVNEFIICAGYKQHVIKEYFADYFLHTSDVTFDFTKGKNDMTIHNNIAEPWKVTVVNTGLETQTGGRVRRVRDYIGDQTFMLTYGDGVSNVDITKLLKFHKNHKKAVTMSAHNPGQRFGVLDVSPNGEVKEFREKTVGDGNLINIGFMVCEPTFIDYIDGDDTVLEKQPMERAAADGNLMAYRHDGFWQCMDTVREKEKLENLWEEGNAPWKMWED